MAVVVKAESDGTYRLRTENSDGRFYFTSPYPPTDIAYIAPGPSVYTMTGIRSPKTLYEFEIEWSLEKVSISQLLKVEYRNGETVVHNCYLSDYREDGRRAFHSKHEYSLQFMDSQFPMLDARQIFSDNLGVNFMTIIRPVNFEEYDESRKLKIYEYLNTDELESGPYCILPDLPAKEMERYNTLYEFVQHHHSYDDNYFEMYEYVPAKDIRTINQLESMEVLMLNRNIQELRTLPSEIGLLTNLKLLDIPNSNMYYLPAEIGNLTQLADLNLEDSQLTELPPEIGNLKNLETLNLNNNYLTELPPEIGNLKKLEELYLEGNELIELPPEIGDLSQLGILNLSYNRLRELPTEIKELSRLENLQIYSNNLRQFPIEILSLINLRELSLSDNQLTQLPDEIGQLTKLEELNLSLNELTSLPSTIGSLTQLKELNLYHNQLTTLPKDIILPSLESLNIGANELTYLPPELRNFKLIDHSTRKKLVPKIGEFTKGA